LKKTLKKLTNLKKLKEKAIRKKEDLQRHKFHLYHILPYILTQNTSENDMRLRRQFYHWVLRMIREDPTFFHYVLFSDETSFYNNGQLNGYNCYYWSTYILTGLSVDNQHRRSLNAW